MSEETPVVIDTREQTEAHTLKLITSAHPEGMVFTVQPQDMSSKQLLKIQNDLCNLLIPLVSPTEEFKSWAEEAEQKWPLAYQAVMRQIMRFVFGKTYF